MTCRSLLTLALAGLAAACGSAPPVEAPVMTLSASAVTFGARIGAADPLPQSITVANSGGGTLGAPAVAVSYGAGSGWLTVAVSGAAAPYTVAMQPALAGLAAGTYTATVSLGSVAAANSPLTVAVTLDVTAGPGTLALSASAVEFRIPAAGAAAAPQVITASSANPGALAAPTATISYAGGTSGWLTVDVGAGPAPYTLTLRADGTGLPDGLATASVEVASEGAGGSPRTVAVKLWVGNVVEVRRLLSFWGEDGTAQEMADPDLAAVALLQDDGAGGLLRIQAQQGLAPGSWLALPAPGAWWAELTMASGRRVQVQAPPAATLLDLGADLGGRPARQAATEATNVDLELSSLMPWRDFDLLRLASWGAQSSASLSPGFGVGDEAARLTLDWSAVMQALLVSEDVLWVGQYRVNTESPLQYLEAVATTSLTGAGIQSGSAFTATAPPATSPAQPLVDVDWRRDAMEAAAAFPSAGAANAHRLGLYAIPAPLASPSPIGATAVTVIEAEDNPGLGDLLAPAVTVGRFLPTPLWREYHEVSFAVPVNPMAVGATTPLPGVANQVRAREAAAATVLARPLVGAPRLPTLDGADLSGATPIAAASLTPVLAWSEPVEPAGVTPTSYEVALVELTEAGGATLGTAVATFVLPGTSVKVPAGLLASGRRYLASITARVRPGDAAGLTPFRVGVPEGTGTTWTAAFDTAP